MPGRDASHGRSRHRQSTQKTAIMRNTTGNVLTLTTFGESHGVALGGVLDGFPAGIAIDEGRVQSQLDRRRPGQSRLTTPRDEADQIEFLSGIYNGVSLGTPVAFAVRNHNAKSSDYDDLAHVYRPSHADYTFDKKYGLRDARGGGRSSARETVARVAAGALAMQALEKLGVSITAYTQQIGTAKTEHHYDELDLQRVDDNEVRCPDEIAAKRMVAEIEKAKAAHDTLGGVIGCLARGVPAGLGDPVFGKLQARLAAAMMSINAAKGFEYGLGFGFAGRLGSQTLDNFVVADGGTVRTKTNYSGGIQGGISNGEDIYFSVAFKPIATMARDMATVDDQGHAVTIHPGGRHDVCVVPRAVPIVEAMAALVLLDSYLLDKTVHL